MKRRGEDGYILASTVGTLLAISIVAAALIGSSTEGYARVKRAEKMAQLNAALDSALTLINVELARDPRRRALNLDDEIDLNALDHPVKAEILWENNKTDVNLAPVEIIERRLEKEPALAPLRPQALAKIRSARAEGKVFGTLDEIGVTEAGAGCLSRAFTVFGGRTDDPPEITDDVTQIGRPAAGSRLSIELALPDENIGLSVIVLVTGDPRTPVEVLDWRRTTGPVGEACRET